MTIPQGKIGYVFARDGAAAAADPDAGDRTSRPTTFQDVAAFLRDRRPARAAAQDPARGHLCDQPRAVRRDHRGARLLPAARPERGGHCSSAWPRSIAERDGFEPVVIKGADDVDRHRHRARRPVARRTGEIIAPTVGDDAADAGDVSQQLPGPGAFLQAGGRRGRQLQVLVDGTYYINRLFATVEMIPKTVVEVGYVGVVVSYTGETGVDLSGDEYKHGELVEHGAARRVERCRCCPASTRSTPTPAR